MPTLASCAHYINQTAPLPVQTVRMVNEVASELGDAQVGRLIEDTESCNRLQALEAVQLCWRSGAAAGVVRLCDIIGCVA